MAVAHDSGEQLRDQLLARPIKALSISSTAGSGDIVNKACLLVAVSARETSGTAAAAFRLRNGSGTSGQLAAAVSLVANGVLPLDQGDEGLFCDGGLFAEHVSGAWEGAVWVRV